MALKLDNSLLEELGLAALPDQEKQLILRQIYEKLEMNVGMRLADQMSNDQLDAFEKFVEANDDKGAFQWLEANFPNYKDVVNEEFEKLKSEIRSVAPQILASAQQSQPLSSPDAQAPQPMQQSQPPMPSGPPAGAPQAMLQYTPTEPQPMPQDQYSAPQQQPMQPQQFSQPAYQQPAQPQYGSPQAAPATIQQNGHLQPQYGTPYGPSAGGQAPPTGMPLPAADDTQAQPLQPAQTGPIAAQPPTDQPGQPVYGQPAASPTMPQQPAGQPAPAFPSQFGAGPQPAAPVQQPGSDAQYDSNTNSQDGQSGHQS